MKPITPSSTYGADNDYDDESSREIHEDIRNTRSQMDETIDKLGEKLSPRNLLDDLLDVFRSDSGKSTGQHLAGTAKTATVTIADVVRRHPMPSLLVAAGAVWWLCEQSEDKERAKLDYRYSDDDFDEAYAASSLGDVPAWESNYDWTRGRETEESWNARAERTLSTLTAGDETTPASQRIRGAAASVVSLSGYDRNDIGTRYSSAQRVGGTYSGGMSNEDYPRHWEHLAAVDAIASDYDSEDETLSEKAAAAWESIKSTLSDATRSTKDRLRDASAAIAEYAAQTGRVTASAGSSVAGVASGVGGVVRNQAVAAGRVTARSARATARSLSSGVQATGRGVYSGYDYTRQGVSYGYGRTRDGVAYGYDRTREGVVEAMDEYPLAVGAACFGIGLLAGLVVPRTRYEDDLMGEQADALKHTAQETAKDVANRGKQIASATAQAALDEAEEIGLTPQQLTETAREAANAVKSAVAKQAKGVAEKSSGLVENVATAAQHVTEKAKSEISKQAQDLKGEQSGTGKSTTASNQNIAGAGGGQSSSPQSGRRDI